MSRHSTRGKHPSKYPLELRGELPLGGGGGTSARPPKTLKQPSLVTPEQQKPSKPAASDTTPANPAAAPIETKLLPEVSQTVPESRESCKKGSNEPIKGAVVRFPSKKPLPDDNDISLRARRVILILTKEFAAVSGDERRATALALAVVGLLVDHFTAAAHGMLAKALQQVKEILGRPSGSSPPASSLELPPPTLLWKNVKSEYPSPYAFVIEQYSPYFSKGWTRAALLGPKGDEPLYYALAYWLRTKTNKDSIPEEFKPNFLTIKERNDNRIAELGGRVTPETVPDLRERNRLNNVLHQRHG